MIHRARKRFGQNFLHDARVIQDIISAIDPQPGQAIVEIGPGQGALSEPLWQSGADLEVIELDRDLVSHLEQMWSGRERVQLHSADALTFDFSTLAQAQPIRVVGNLPYNISTPLLFHLLSFAGQIQDMHFMLQKEVVLRMAATPGHKAYGRLSIMLQLRCQVEPLFDVAPECFDPAPKVTSAVVRLTPKTASQMPVVDLKALDQLVTKAFSQRRKTLRNALKGLCEVADMEAVGIEPSARAETIPIETFVRLSERLAEAPD